LDKLEAQASAARRARTKRNLFRLVVAAVVIIGGLAAYSFLVADDDDDGDAAAEDEAPATTTAADCSAQAQGQAPLPTEWSDPTVADEVLAREAPDPEPPPADTSADALDVETLIEGESDVAAAAGDCIYVHYVGKIPDGTVFDESWSREQPFPVLLGQGMVIPGWDQGLVDATIGERVRLVIGSDNAYGAEGGGETIPPNTPLAFEVDVVDVVPTELSGAATEDSAADSTETTAAAETTTTAAPAESTTAPTG
jgi:FKBP-type peptidyl-prolyl cis-trans isomerase